MKIEPYVLPAPAEMPAAANENLRLKGDWMTNAEFVQRIAWLKDRWRKEVAADPTRFGTPEYRLEWANIEAMERCGRWHLFGDRSVR